ncbi:MAG: D-alanyl-D-alanine carboxypeptidase family protein, partial [Limosilactobacillus sp.]
MKKFFATLMMIPLLLGIIAAPVHAAPLIDASAAIMVDASTGQVIYEQNAQQKLPIASISKLLTAIVVEDEVHSNQITGNTKVKIDSGTAAISNDPNYSAIGLQEGQSYTVRELLNAALVKSADGATMALAGAAGDSLDEFNMKLQQKAQDIGLKDYTIVNPVGLNNGDLKSLASKQYSDKAENAMTATDVAILARYLVNRYPQLLQVTAQKQATFAIAKGKTKTEKNLNEMLPGGKYTVPGVTIDGLKTGTSDTAGACFVSTGNYRGHRIITVVLHANGDNKDNRFIQTQRL